MLIDLHQGQSRQGRVCDLPSLRRTCVANRALCCDPYRRLSLSPDHKHRGRGGLPESHANDERHVRYKYILGTFAEVSDMDKVQIAE